MRLRFLPEVVAQNLDDTPGAGRSLRWNVDSAHFVIDVRNALSFAFANQHDKEGLWRAWVRFLRDDSTIRESEARLIQLAAPVFRKRGLEPIRYFTHIKRGRGEQREAA